MPANPAADNVNVAYLDHLERASARTCSHGVRLGLFCLRCNPEAVADAVGKMGVTDAERDRRLKAFMPLLHKMVDQGHTAGYAPDEVLIARIERVLEIVEHPRRKVEPKEWPEGRRHDGQQ